MNDASMYDVLLQLAKKRRTVRRFKSDPIPADYITKIIDVARWAPSGFHTQPWEFLVITEKEIKEKVVSILGQHGPAIRNPNEPATKEDPSQGRFDVAPVFIILLGDWRARVGLPEAAQSSDARVDNLFRTSLADAFLSMQLAAASLGLASQWYSAVSGEKVQSAVKALIGIPESLRIFDMMVLGYAAEDPISKDVRELSEMIHYNACGVQDFRTDKEVIAYARKTKAWCLAAH
ncbi:MAG: nitroreductase family protein [Syntrophorhabdales bacterium]|jgi:nitroreductase